MSPAERGKYLESPPEDAPDIEEAHQVCWVGGGVCAWGQVGARGWGERGGEMYQKATSGGAPDIEQAHQVGPGGGLTLLKQGQGAQDL